MSIAASFIRAVTSAAKHHIYVSKSHDVAINLSIEHYLFQKSHPDSILLFLYANNPCIVIGRNQNPWLEVNHALVQQTSPTSSVPSTHHDASSGPAREKIKVIRRRSGGGTVFHDLGNVNFSVICPPADFHRDKHAEMVVHAIRKINPRARVNERHDIVLDPGALLAAGDRPSPDNTHRTAYGFGEEPLAPRKVSGSAYKLTRRRALHHGTCLLASPNIAAISQYLQSPARPFMKARGVESVRSPIANIVNTNHGISELIVPTFQRQIIEAFINMYELNPTILSRFLEASTFVTQPEHDGGCVTGTIDDTLLDIPEILSGVQELESPEYLYNQTPQFILSTHPCDEDERYRPPLPEWFPPSARIYLKIKSGTIISSQISTSEDPGIVASERTAFDEILRDKQVQDLESFWDVLGKVSEEDAVRRVAAWLDLMMGKRGVGGVA
ncbi:MAG: hypothetical protein Q9219_000118 [cf. Caloplaca sp. 3 TL-2023]